MLIAKVENGQVLDVADYRAMFPGTSFSANGPDASFMEANACLPVTMWKAYDPVADKLVSCTPYIEGGQVFTVAVAPKTLDDLQADVANQTAQQTAARAQAYRDESDPLFFKAQRGEATMDDWLAKVNEIKARYPMPAPAPDTIVGA